MKKILALVACLSLVASLAIGGSIAYLTDRDSETNVFTVGNVEIDLTESFDQGTTLNPGIDIEKKPVITNTGANDAWVWMTFSIPSALDNFVEGTEKGSNENVIHWNPLGATAEDYVTEDRVTKAIADGHLPVGSTAADILAQNKTWNVFNSLGEGKNVYQETINGMEYNTYVLLYNKALASGETTLPSIFKVFLDAQVDIDPNGDWYKIVDGKATKLNWNSNDDGTPIIYVSAYGIQKEGFDTVDAAYAAYSKQWGDNGTEYGNVVYGGSNVESGATRPAGYEVPLDGGVIDGLTVVDKTDAETNLRALYCEGGINGSLLVKNSLLDGTYAMNLTTKKADATLTFENTTFMGWTSYSGFKNVSFTDCTFKMNSEKTYNYIRAYDDTIFINCEFKGTKLDLDLADSSYISLVDCTYNGKKITSENLSDLLDDASEAKYVNFNANTVSTEKELQTAVEQGGTIILKNDINLTNVAGLNFTKDTVLFLNGNDISAKGDAIVVTSGAMLIINGEGTVSAGNGVTCNAVWANGGDVVINGGTFVGSKDETGNGNDTIYTKNGGTATINGGEYYAELATGFGQDQYSCLNENDENRDTITVKGGIFHRFSPAYNWSEGKGTNFVAPGYKVNKTNNDHMIYTVVAE